MRKEIRKSFQGKYLTAIFEPLAMKKMYMKKSDEIYSIPLDDTKNYFYTPDIEIASTLLSKGFELATICKHRSGKATFIFNRTPDLDVVTQGYWGGKVVVDPLGFATARKNLKSRLFAMETIRY